MKLPRPLDRALHEGGSRLAKHLYRDAAGGAERATLIAGVARSGTTWLAEVLASQSSTRVMFEPFNPVKVDAYRSFEYVQYMPPERDDPMLEAFVSDVLTGRLRDPAWVDRMVTVLRPDSRLVKAVRISLMLRWIHDRFPRTPTVLIVRHPCAVAASFARLGWSARPDLDSLLRQPELLEDHLDGLGHLLRGELSPPEEVAVVWAVSHRVALRQCAGSDVLRVHYEDLVAHPDREIGRVFRGVGREYDESVHYRLGRPSRTAKVVAATSNRGEGRPDWLRDLGPSAVARVLSIVSAFGLDDLYDDGGQPTGALHDRD